MLAGTHWANYALHRHGVCPEDEDIVHTSMLVVNTLRKYCIVEPELLRALADIEELRPLYVRGDVAGGPEAAQRALALLAEISARARKSATLDTQEAPVNGLMMDQPLLVSSLLKHAERHHGRQEIVSRRVEGDLHRYTFGELGARGAAAGPGARRARRRTRRTGSATLAWNGYRHLELYYAVSGSGAVLHTLNPRLHPDQLDWIVNRREDQVLFFDLTFLPLVEELAPRLTSVRHFVLMSDRAPPARWIPARCWPTRTCSRRRTAPTSGPSSTRPPRPRCVTPAEPPETPRASCTATAPPSCTPTRSRCPIRSACPPATACCRSCRCSTSTPGACPMPRAWSAPRWSSRAPRPRRRGALRAAGNRAGHRVGQRADRVAGTAPVRGAATACGSPPCSARSSAVPRAPRRCCANSRRPTASRSCTGGA